MVWGYHHFRKPTNIGMNRYQSKMGKITWGLSPQKCQWIVKVQWEAKKVKKVKLLLVILAGGLIVSLKEQKTAWPHDKLSDLAWFCSTLHPCPVGFFVTRSSDVRQSARCSLWQSYAETSQKPYWTVRRFVVICGDLQFETWKNLKNWKSCAKHIILC